MIDIRERLAKNPRFKMIDEATPIQELSELNKMLNGIKIFIKRDDVMSIGLGGNKLRKLEYLMGDALAQGANHVITMGGRQSNHARLTAAAACRTGLMCDLVLSRTVPITTADYNDNGNIVLNHIFNANIIDVESEQEAVSAVETRLKDLNVQGKRPYFIPTGGSNAIGCLGYVNCFQEILDQSISEKLRFDAIVVPNGSSGTHAGLLAGALASGSPIQIRSYNVLSPAGQAQQSTLQKTREVLQLIAPGMELAEDIIDIDNDHLGQGYGLPTTEMREALILLARTEGILLDPVYSGKAFAGLLSDIRKGYFQKSTQILFIATGGIPGLFAYRSLF